MFNFFKKIPFSTGSNDELTSTHIGIDSKAFADLRSEFNAQAKELDLEKAKTIETQKEAELLLAQLIQVQEELEIIFLQKTEFNEHAKELDLAKSTIIKTQQESEVLLRAANNELNIANQTIENLRSQLDAHAKELDLAKSTIIKTQQESEVLLRAVNNELNIANQTIENLRSQLDAQAKELEEAKSEMDSLLDISRIDKIEEQLAIFKRENEFLLKQEIQAKEELESVYLDKVKFEELHQIDKSRWARLQKRYPNYLDFEDINIIDHSSTAETPYVKWSIKDLNSGDKRYDHLLFQTLFKNGSTGIAILNEDKSISHIGGVLIFNPTLSSDSLEYYLQMSQSEFCKIRAAIDILTQSEAMGWKGIEFPKDFDLIFWRESFRALGAKFKALPIRLRYDDIKLKRELINPDYEHLWLEFRGVGFGNHSWPKFECRLAAAMIEQGQFSRFPKIEIPLINGKTKPFNSWYAESSDDNGAKLELRFALEKNIFDTRVWSKLEVEDRRLLLQLIFTLPDALERLQAEHAVIHRPWKTWIDFTKASIKVIDSCLRTAAMSKNLKNLPALSGSEEHSSSNADNIIMKKISHSSSTKTIKDRAKLLKRPVVAKKIVIKKKQ